MFDIGFWEISLIMVVALLVIGPERLPGVARKAGLWVNKGRRFISTIKADIEHEIAADELKKTLNNHSEFTGVHEIIEETRADIGNINDELRSKFGGKSVEEPASEEPVPEVIGHSSGGSLDTSVDESPDDDSKSNKA